MTGLNPYVAEIDKEIRTYLVPFDSDYYNYINSNTFKEFLLYDGTTSEGRVNIAKHYGVLKEWNSSPDDDDFLTQYYNLLLLVKTTSTKDNVWISFVEGLHRHAAIVLSLLCSKFDYGNNNLLPKSIDITTFEKADIQHFKHPDNTAITPVNLINNINSDDGVLCMLKNHFIIKAFYPSQTECDMSTFTSALTSKSLSHSNNKINSAQKTISSKTATGLLESLNNSNSKQRKNEKRQPIFTGLTMSYQDMIKYPQYEKLRKESLSNDDDFLGYPQLLLSNVWLEYIKKPFNSEARQYFINSDSVCPTIKSH